MSKKIVIVQPNVGEDTAQRQKDAEQYVRDLGYEVLDFSPEDIISIMTKCPQDEKFHSAPFIIGATSILMAMGGNVCFGYGWRSVSYCQDLFQIAFKYGLNIVQMPEE